MKACSQTCVAASRVEAFSLQENCIEDICSICAQPILHYSSDYFMGEKVNPACVDCNVRADENYGKVPFSSYPETGLPYSLVTQWTPPFVNHSSGIGTISSLRTHYLQLADSGDSFTSNEEFFAELRELWAEDRRIMKEECKQS